MGLAGAGKSAVLRTIGRRDPGIRAGLSIDRLRFAPVLARSALALIPTLLRLERNDRHAWWRGVVTMVRLRTLPTVLAHQARSPYRVIVLDEGPVFSLTRLCVFQNANRAGGRLSREWQGALERCGAMLDGIVWLDAPDPLLLRRIQERDKAPVIKGGTTADVARLLVRYREAYHDVVTALSTRGGVPLLEIDTSRRLAEQVASDILAALPPFPMLGASTPDAGRGS